MRPRRHAVVGGIVAAVLLVPALMWSGIRSFGAEARNAFVKLPEVSTIGPETIPYVLTPAEREKLALPAIVSAIPLEHLYDAWPKSVLGSEQPYTGMTPAELEKFAGWQAHVRELAASCTPRVTTPPKEPVSTIEVVPRVPGIEGMTPQEKAKLEAYVREGGRR